MTKQQLRDPSVTFSALLEYLQGLYQILQEDSPPNIPLIIYAIGTCRETPTVSDIAEISGATLKTTSRVLKDLRGRGWIELVGDPTDTRKRRVRFTKAGDVVARLINGAFTDCAFKVVENVLGKHPQADAATLRRKPHSEHK